MSDGYELSTSGANLPATQQNSPFTSRALSSAVNVGSVAIEQERAIAEVQGQIIVAQRFPRDLTKSHAELMTACKSKAFAAAAFYTVPNRGTGPSIRFAEEVARVFGNFQFGHREIGRSEGKSEIEVFAWDVEKNNRSIRQITVMHITDTKSGPKILRDQADIDNKIANVASKQMRGRILALMPKWLVEDAITECRKTLAGNNTEPLEARVRRMTQAFKEKFGVSAEHLTAYMKKPLDQLLVEELVDLQGVYNAIKEGARASDYFGANAVEDADVKGEPAKAAAEAVLAAGKKMVDAATQTGAKAADAPTPAATPAAAPAAQEKAADAPAATPPAQPAAKTTRKPAAAPAPAKAPAAPAPEPEPEQQASQDAAPESQQDDGPPDNIPPSEEGFF